MKKNVLFILTDGMRADCLGAGGNPVIQTPNLDGLAQEGVLFTNCFAQTTPCSPSRMAIFTGRYLCSTGCVDNCTPLADAEDNIGMHARNHGVSVGLLGYHDYTVDPRTLPEGDPPPAAVTHRNVLPGFEVVLEHAFDSPEYFAYLREQGYPADVCTSKALRATRVPEEGSGKHLPLRYPAPVPPEHSGAQFATSKAIDYIREHAGDGWFLSLNYITPHGPWLCPAPYNNMYDPGDMPEPVRRAAELDGGDPYLSRFALNAPGAFVEEREWRETRACVYGMISEMDACLGRLFQALRDSGQWGNTLIVFSSDHGEHLGDHYLDGKAHYFDSGMRVPYIVRDPSPEADVTRGQRLDGLCEAIDTAPTICEYLGIPTHERFQGRSVLGQLRNRADAYSRGRIHYEFYYHYSLKPEEKAKVDLAECRFWVVRDHRYKYVQFCEESLPPRLFDLENDPGEFENLADRPEYAALVAEFCQQLLRWRMRNEDVRLERWSQPYR